MTLDIQAQDLQGKPQDAAVVQNSSNDGHEVFTKNEVSSLIRREVQRERANAYEKGRKDRDAELNIGGMPMQSQAQSGAPLGNISSNSNSSMTPDAIKEMIAKEAPKAIQDHVRSLQIHQTATDFAKKMEAAESKYPGLREKLNKLDYTTAAPVVQLVNQTDNSADVMNELIENPMKMAHMITLAHSQPAFAQSAMASLSSSIKQNETAKQANQRQPNDPLDAVSPSVNTGMDSGAPQTVSDFQKLFKRRRR